MKRKVRIDFFADHGEIDLVALGDRRPVMHAGAAERIDAQVDAGAADRVEVDHAAQVAHVGVEEIVLMRGALRGAPA